MDTWLAAELEIDGEFVRFGGDEGDPQNIPSAISWGTSNPGGYGDASFTINRPEWGTREALLFCPGRIYGPGGKTYYRGRVKDVSQAGATAIRIDLEGYKVLLDDNENFREIYVDRSFERWGEPSAALKLALVGTYAIETGSVTPDATTGQPALVSSVGPKESTTRNGLSETIYDASGIALGSVYYAWTKSSNVNAGDANWNWAVLSDSVDTLTSVTSSGNLRAAGPGSGTLTCASDDTFVAAQFWYSTAGALNETYQIHWTDLAVFGAHGLTKRGSAPDQGFYGSDIIEHALGAAAPELDIEPDGIEQSPVVITHFVHLSGTLRELIETVTGLAGGVDLNDWGVYEGFFWRSPGSHGRTWRVRRDQVATPTDDGPTASERFARVVIAYTDAAGTEKTVGPPGSGADVEDDRLVDPDETNPAHRASSRTVRKTVGLLGSSEHAILIGQAYLGEQNNLSRRGSVTVQGTVTDEDGHEQPVCAMRACDKLVIEDEPGVEPITLPLVDTSYSHDDLTLTANRGATPQRTDVLVGQLAAAVARL